MEWYVLLKESVFPLFAYVMERLFEVKPGKVKISYAMESRLKIND